MDRTEVIKIIKNTLLSRGIPEGDMGVIDKEYLMFYTMKSETGIQSFNHSRLRLDTLEDNIDAANRLANCYYGLKNDDWRVLDYSSSSSDFDHPDVLTGMAYVIRPSHTIAEILTDLEYKAARLLDWPNSHIVDHVWIRTDQNKTGKLRDMRSIRKIQCAADVLSPAMQKSEIKSIIQPTRYEGSSIWVYADDNIIFFLNGGEWIHMNLSEFEKCSSNWSQEVQAEYVFWKNIDSV